jgi:exo-beta-1,3-glucanase (GH17 family)
MVLWRLAQLFAVAASACVHATHAASYDFNMFNATELEPLDDRRLQETNGSAAYDFHTFNATELEPISRRLEQGGNVAHGNVAACYTPFHNNEYPLFGGSVNINALRGAIEEDFRVMSKYFTHVRTYYAQHFGIEMAPIAAKYGLKLYLGAFLTSESWWNDEANAAANAIKKYPGTVEAVLTGNENLAGFYQRSWDILNKINDIKARAGGAVNNVKYGTVQRINEFVDSRFDWDMQQLNNNLDILGVNIYPFFTNSYDGNRQSALLDAQWNQVTSRYPAHKIRLTETGYPTSGSASSVAPNVWPGIDSAVRFYQGVVDWTPRGYENHPKFWFQAFDRRYGDPGANGHDYELSFGFLTTQRSLKRDGFPRQVMSAAGTTPLQSSCAIDEATDYSGADIGSKPAPQAENCFAICSAFSGCRAFTWTSYGGGTCWLKSGKGNAAGKNGARSGMACSGANSVCTVDEGADYSGWDIGSKPATQAESCFGICNSFSGCKAFTWTSYGGGTCWLKSNKGNSGRKSGARSGVACNGVVMPSCGIEDDADFSGSDIGNKPAARAESCFAICNSVSGCGAFTWSSYAGGTCWLKSTKGSSSEKSGLRSGVACKCNLGGLEPGVDYAGADVGNSLGANPEACISLCKNTNGCRAFTWTSYFGGTCWFKSGKGNASAKSGATSGVIC